MSTSSLSLCPGLRLRSAVRPEAPPSEFLLLLARRRTIYTPRDAANDLGVSHDTVCRAMQQRPRKFPPRAEGYTRKIVWETFEDYLIVLSAVCGISSLARRAAWEKISGLNAP